MTLPARLIAHAECHESQPELMSDPEQRQWAADLREAARLTQGWLPAEDAPEDTYVACTGYIGNDPAAGRWVTRGCVNGGTWFDDDGEQLYPPTHYTPLPTAPKEPRQ